MELLLLVDRLNRQIVALQNFPDFTSMNELEAKTRQCYLENVIDHLIEIHSGLFGLYLDSDE